MLWSVAIWMLLMEVNLSTQDMVTLSPGLDTQDTVTESVEKYKYKPTIRSLHITSEVKNRYATTLVSSKVVNPYYQATEAVFFVTLPESAFISDFLMEIKGTVYKAYVKEKEEAKAEYDQAVQAGLFAGHVAFRARDSNEFTVSINIEAHGKVIFNLTYEQLLSRHLGTYSNIINIDPQQLVEDMSVTVNIEELRPITNLEVPELQESNEVTENVKQNPQAKIEVKSPQSKKVVWAPTLNQQKERNSNGVSGQFIVRYDVDRETNSQQILVDEGYFVHFYAPEDLPKLKKHVVFVLDYSGSMVGRKLEQLRDAMDKILSDLDPKDYFSIVIFQSYIQAWSPTKLHVDGLKYISPWELEHKQLTHATLDQEFVVEASPTNIDLSRSYLKNYSEIGGTNIMGGLRKGLELVNIGISEWINESNPPQPVLIFLTDGQPNIEEYNTDAIINKTKHLNAMVCPIFSLAFGYGADFDFLRKLSLTNNAFARNIYEAADASAQLKNFYQTVSSPLLTNVTFKYLPGQVDNSSYTKNDFAVYFKGSEFVVAGKINKETVKDNATIGELTAVTAKGLQNYPIIVDNVLKSNNRSLGHLEKAWAYLSIQQLLDKAVSIDSSEEKNQTIGKAQRLALQYSFVTPLTSLVVVKPNETESAVNTAPVRPGTRGAQPQSNVRGGLPGLEHAPSSLPQPSGQTEDWVDNADIVQETTCEDTVDSSKCLTQEQELNQNSTQHKTSQPEPFVEKVALNEIKWLQQLTNSSGLDNITVTVGDLQYILASNVTDESFGTCQVNNKFGDCRHLRYCALNVFQDNVSQFIPYQCFVRENYLAVCCPI